MWCENGDAQSGRTDSTISKFVSIKLNLSQIKLFLSWDNPFKSPVYKPCWVVSLSFFFSLSLWFYCSTTTANYFLSLWDSVISFRKMGKITRCVDSFSFIFKARYVLVYYISVQLRVVCVLCNTVVNSNGKTSLVHYRTLSFFAFRFLKKRKFAFFPHFKHKISIEPVRFASILVKF